VVKGMLSVDVVDNDKLEPCGTVVAAVVTHPLTGKAKTEMVSDSAAVLDFSRYDPSRCWYVTTPPGASVDKHCDANTWVPAPVA
jgi:hypothetical protein